jgi:hypothetical protein
MATATAQVAAAVNTTHRKAKHFFFIKKRPVNRKPQVLFTGFLLNFIYPNKSKGSIFLLSLRQRYKKK